MWLSKARLRSYERLEELHGLLPEPLFIRALCLERKRTERSRKPFVLMLLDPGRTVHNGDADSVLSRTATVLLSAIRETDIAGWYKEDSTLGVIFVPAGNVGLSDRGE